jgi:hypothetical protein
MSLLIVFSGGKNVPWTRSHSDAVRDALALTQRAALSSGWHSESTSVGDHAPGDQQEPLEREARLCEGEHRQFDLEWAVPSHRGSFEAVGALRCDQDDELERVGE